MEFKTLEIIQRDPSVSVFHIYLNRPSQNNALSLPFFDELPKALSLLDDDPSVSVIVLSGRGRHFCSGIDLSALGSVTSSSGSDAGRSRERLRRSIRGLQSSISAVERCRKPVLAAIHGACVGGGVDLAAACDVRYCCEGAFFSVKEVDLAIVADLGTLQRLPRIVGYGHAAELALTGRRFSAAEAREMGFVSRVFSTADAMDESVGAIAREMAGKSPLALMGAKAVLLRSRDQTVEDGLDYVATWNSSMLISEDLDEALSAHLHKRKPTFSKL
ncbi:Peroxisomal fatty acid beta-oxidation multifunctional protein AIM1 [Acorus calamus]|uniref:Peroxisomal fatty acid beta-oxidation multifunctional protein AIM1 n=1 Tax=Acorus calamus TaxID=4465 RepID=A0AAV9C023_ACOCL|nr:Peroxisomal fatty acid beta-oxidation multifunctional protein AIM1 [Acorus calamus]